MKKFIFILFISGFAMNGRAQLSGYNLLEAQLGNVPGESPDDLKTAYDQLNIQYQWKGLKVSTRLEQFYTTRPAGDQYAKFTQYSLNYRKDGFEAKLGNFYETLGRGLLLRGYEIPNSIFEDRIYRVRQGFYKDIRGAFTQYSNDWVEIKALHGRNLTNQLPPDHPDNREDLVSAGELSFTVFNQHIGAIFLDNEHSSNHSQYLSLHWNTNISDQLDFYTEIAHQTNGEGKYLSFGSQSSYGAYFNLNYSANNFGASLEWKDYHNFLIGSGLSDPPTLIKEHSYRTLNRSTHVGELLDEQGIQLELFYSLNDMHRFTFNHSRGENNFGKIYQFQEYFLEWYADFSQFQLKAFIDYSLDEFKQEDNRFAGGIYLSNQLGNQWQVSLETEAQQIQKTYGEMEKSENYYAGLIVSKSSKFSTSLVWEFTNDPIIADLPSTTTIETKKNYVGANISYKPNYNNTIQLFAGERRGGPACTSGVCYEVLDFSGLEIRWTKRF